jgi:hypothetical protein
MKSIFAVLLTSLLAGAGNGSAHPDRERHIAGIGVSEHDGAGRRAARLDCADTLYSFPCPGTWALGLAWDGSCFWVCDVTDRPYLFRLDTTGQVVRQLPPMFASDVEWVNSCLWCTNEEDATLTEIDPLTGDSLRAFMLPDSASEDPNCMGLAWDGSYLWVSRYADSARLYQIDTATGQPVFSFPPPTDRIVGIAWDGAYLWGVDAWSGWIYKMNPPDSSVADSLPWPLIYATGLEWVGPDIWNLSSGGGIGTNRVYKLGGITTIAERAPVTKSRLLLDACPNPFSGQIRLRLTASGSRPAVRVYDVNGALVRDLGIPHSLTPSRGTELMTWAANCRTASTWSGSPTAARAPADRSCC